MTILDQKLSILERLKLGRERLADEKNWCQGRYTTVSLEGDVQYCLTGACGFGLPDGYDILLYFMLKDSILRLYPTFQWNVLPTPACFNDLPDRKHADILAVLDLAIERAKACQS